MFPFFFWQKSIISTFFSARRMCCSIFSFSANFCASGDSHIFNTGEFLIVFSQEKTTIKVISVNPLVLQNCFIWTTVYTFLGLNTRKTEAGLNTFFFILQICSSLDKASHTGPLLFPVLFVALKGTQPNKKFWGLQLKPFNFQLSKDYCNKGI